jgi:hypothetical protein
MAIARSLLLALVALSAPLSAKAKRHANEQAILPIHKFVVDSALPSGTVVGCLEKRNTKAAVLRINSGYRVMLGPAEGWIDVSRRPEGSRLETRTEWVGARAMERWARACAIGRTPPKPGLLARL